MKVYKESDSIFPKVDSKSVADDFHSASEEIADIVSKLTDIRNRVEYLHKVTQDNGDVAIELSEAIEKLGIALAVCVIYAKEYADEANDNDEN